MDVDRWQEREERWRTELRSAQQTSRREAREKSRRERRPEVSQPTPVDLEPQAFLSVHAGKRVLVADSSQVIRTAAAMVLEPTGIEVREAPNQLLALKALSEQDIDLVLLDSDFDPDGCRHFIEHLRSEPGTEDLPVILLTGLERRDSVDSSLAAPVLIKPFDSQELIDLAEQALTGSPPPCPTCDHPVDGSGRACSRCGAVHHQECWKLYDGCGKCQAET